MTKMTHHYVENVDNLWYFIIEHSNGRKEYKESFKTKGEAIRAMEMHIRAENLHKRKLESDIDA